MAEEVVSKRSEASRDRSRRLFVVSAITIVLVASLLTTYFALPRLALERGLAFETYSDFEALSFVGPRELRKPVIGKNGVYHRDGWDVSYQGFLDRERRFVLVEAQLSENGRNAPAIWAILDANEERIIGSFRVPQPFARRIGMDTWTSAHFVGTARTSDSSDANALELGCRVELPRWWPARTRIGNSQGAIWRPIHVRFDTDSHRWEPYASQEILAWDDPRIWDRLTRERTVRLEGTEDELVVQHRAVPAIGQSNLRSEGKVLHFERLARRHRLTREVRWETHATNLPPTQGLNDPFEMMLPGFPLESGLTWCLIGQKLSDNRLPITMKYWKLDMDRGDFVDVSPPHPPAAWDREIVSDGQTLLLRDATQSVLAWHPDRGTERAGGSELSNSDNIGALSRRRILCVDHLKGGDVIIQIVSLDNGQSRQIYP